MAIEFDSLEEALQAFRTRPRPDAAREFDALGEALQGAPDRGEVFTPAPRAEWTPESERAFDLEDVAAAAGRLPGAGSGPANFGGNLLGTVLDYLGRPAASVAGFTRNLVRQRLANPRAARDPLGTLGELDFGPAMAAAGETLEGRRRDTFADVLGDIGVPDEPFLPGATRDTFLLGGITPRSAAGLGLDVVADPLNLVPAAPIARGLDEAGRLAARTGRDLPGGLGRSFRAVETAFSPDASRGARISGELADRLRESQRAIETAPQEAAREVAPLVREARALGLDLDTVRDIAEGTDAGLLRALEDAAADVGPRPAAASLPREIAERRRDYGRERQAGQTDLFDELETRTGEVGAPPETFAPVRASRAEALTEADPYTGFTRDEYREMLGPKTADRLEELASSNRWLDDPTYTAGRAWLADPVHAAEVRGISAALEEATADTGGRGVARIDLRELGRELGREERAGLVDAIQTVAQEDGFVVGAVRSRDRGRVLEVELAARPPDEIVRALVERLHVEEPLTGAERELAEHLHGRRMLQLEEQAGARAQSADVPAGWTAAHGEGAVQARRQEIVDELWEDAEARARGRGGLPAERMRALEGELVQLRAREQRSAPSRALAEARPDDAPALPKQVQRFEEEGVAPSWVSKPQGLYTTPADVLSPHADLGGQRTTYDVNPKAKVLTVDMANSPRLRKGAVGSGTGIVALKRLVGDKDFEELTHLTKQALVARLTKTYPTIDWSLYYDRQDLLEGLGGVIAREHGYDALWGPDTPPEFSEFVALTENAFVKARPTDAPWQSDPAAHLREVAARVTRQREAGTEGVGGFRIGRVEDPELAPLLRQVAQAPGLSRRTRHDTVGLVKARRIAAALEQNPTHLIDTDERWALRTAIAEQLYGTGAARKERVAAIVLGPPASGKSKLVAEPVAARLGALTIDSDAVKELLPEFRDGLGAGRVHLESANVAREMILPRAAAEGDNLVLPLVGRNYDVVAAQYDELVAQGYRVAVYLTELSLEKAAERTVGRFHETGRLVDPEYVLKVGDSPLETYRRLIDERSPTTHGRLSTDVPRGAEPLVLESSAGATSRDELLRSLDSGRGSNAPGPAGGKEVPPGGSSPQLRGDRGGPPPGAAGGAGGASTPSERAAQVAAGNSPPPTTAQPSGPTAKQPAVAAIDAARDAWAAPLREALGEGPLTEALAEDLATAAPRVGGDAGQQLADRLVGLFERHRAQEQRLGVAPREFGAVRRWVEEVRRTETRTVTDTTYEPVTRTTEDLQFQKVPLTREEVAAKVDGILGRLDSIQDDLLRAEQSVEFLEDRGFGVVRPNWAAGWTDNQLVELARRHDLNPFEEGWWDAGNFGADIIQGKRVLTGEMRYDVLESGIQSDRRGVTKSQTREHLAALRREEAALRLELAQIQAAGDEAALFKTVEAWVEREHQDYVPHVTRREVTTEHLEELVRRAIVPYVPRRVARRSPLADLGALNPPAVGTSLGGFAKRRTFRTAAEGRAAGVEYVPTEQAAIERIAKSIRAVESATLIDDVKTGRIVDDQGRSLVVKASTPERAKLTGEQADLRRRLAEGEEQLAGLAKQRAQLERRFADHPLQLDGKDRTLRTSADERRLRRQLGRREERLAQLDARRAEVELSLARADGRLREVERDLGLAPIVADARPADLADAASWRAERKAFSRIKELSGYEAHPDVVDALEVWHRTFVDDASVQGLLRAFDAVQGTWKALVTGPFVAFHMRNMVGNFWNNWLGGLDNPARYVEAASVQAGAEGAVRGVTYAEIRHQVERLLAGGGQFGADIPELLRRELGETGPSKLQVAGDVGLGVGLGVLTGAVAFPPSLGRRFGSVLENNSKVAYVLDRLHKGEDLATAIASARKWTIDYGDLTPFERNVMKRAIPFYTWSRKNLPLQLEAVVSQPAKIAAFSKLMAELDQGETLSVEERLLMPKYLRDELGIVLGRDNEANPLVLAGLGLPIEDLNKLWRGTSKDTARQWLGMLGPLQRMVGELGTGLSAFTGRRIDDEALSNYYRRVYPAIAEKPLLAAWLEIQRETIKDPDTGEERTVYSANPLKAYLLGSVLGRYTATGGKLADTRKDPELRMLNWATGARVQSAQVQRPLLELTVGGRQALREASAKWALASEAYRSGELDEAGWRAVRKQAKETTWKTWDEAGARAVKGANLTPAQLDELKNARTTLLSPAEREIQAVYDLDEADFFALDPANGERLFFAERDRLMANLSPEAKRSYAASVERRIRALPPVVQPIEREYQQALELRKRYYDLPRYRDLPKDQEDQVQAAKDLRTQYRGAAEAAAVERGITDTRALETAREQGDVALGQDFPDALAVARKYSSAKWTNPARAAFSRAHPLIDKWFARGGGQAAARDQVAARQAATTLADAPADQVQDVDASSPAAFVRSLAPAAERLERTTGIPAAFTVAVAANETGWGHAMPGGNLFGIKGSGAGSIEQPTWEVVDGQRVDVRDRFAAYGSVEEAVQALGQVLSQPRYGAAFRATSVADFAEAVRQGGYATDPEWATKVWQLSNEVRRHWPQPTATTGDAQQMAASLPPELRPTVPPAGGRVASASLPGVTVPARTAALVGELSPEALRDAPAPTPPRGAATAGRASGGSRASGGRTAPLRRSLADTRPTDAPEDLPGQARYALGLTEQIEELDRQIDASRGDGIEPRQLLADRFRLNDRLAQLRRSWRVQGVDPLAPVLARRRALQQLAGIARAYFALKRSGASDAAAGFLRRNRGAILQQRSALLRATERASGISADEDDERDETFAPAA